MALSERDIEELCTKIINGKQEQYVAEMTDLMLDNLRDGVFNFKSSVALKHLAKEFPKKSQNILLKYRKEINEEVRTEIENVLKLSIQDDKEELENAFSAQKSDVADKTKHIAGASKHFNKIASQTATGLCKIVRRQNVKLESAYERAWYAATETAVNAVSLGTVSQQSALARGVNQLLAAGVQVIPYQKGGKKTVTNHVDVALRRHIVTQTVQAGGRMTLDLLKQNNHNLVITSAHYGARETHAEWQGKPCAMSGPVVVDGVTYPDLAMYTGYGTVEGLQGANCRHSLHPYYPGITKLPDTEFKEAQEHFGMSSNEYYKATQKQRYYERKVREKKRAVASMERVGVGFETPEYVQKRLELGAAQQKLVAHCKATGLTRQYAREKAYGVTAQPRALWSEAASEVVRTTEGRVNIEIDKFVPCLLEKETGELVETNVFKMKSRSKLKEYNSKTGWDINWSKIEDDKEIYALCVKGSDTIEGLIALKEDKDAKAVYLHYLKAAPHNDKRTNGLKKYEGIGGHLIAIAGEVSYKKGYDGCVYGFAENLQLLEHYCKEYGAEYVGILHPNQFVFSSKVMKSIMNTYTYEWRNNGKNID